MGSVVLGVRKDGREKSDGREVREIGRFFFRLDFGFCFGSFWSFSEVIFFGVIVYGLGIRFCFLFFVVIRIIGWRGVRFVGK